MKTLGTFVLVIGHVLSPIAASAQAPPSAQQTALQELLNEQLRRIEALEARLAQLQQEINVVKGQQPPVTVDDGGSARGAVRTPVRWRPAGGPY